MNAKDAWLATMGQLQVQLNRATYDTWLRRAELLGFEDGRFVVTVPNAYARDWLEQHLMGAMAQTLSRLLERECEVQFVVWDPVDTPRSDQGPLFEYLEHTPTPVSKTGSSDGSPLNVDYTFDTFLVGDANRYPSLLAQAIVDAPLGKYSPVLFNGPMGVGKTHLLHAIAHRLIAQGHRVVYLTAEEFTTQLVASIRGQLAYSFRERFRTADAVLIDDLQFIEGKEATQAELVAIWDSLRHRKRPIIFASDRLPFEMQRLSKEAMSRFQAGPIATLDQPDLALRKSILSAKSAQRKVYLPPEVRDQLAQRLATNVRELEGAIEQLCVYASLTGNAITMASLQSVLRNLGTLDVPQTITVEKVIECVAQFCKVSVVDLLGPKRTKAVANARQLAMYMARELTSASLPQIGEAMGGRNHSTIVHGCARVQEMIEAEYGFAADVEALRAMITNSVVTPTTSDEEDEEGTDTPAHFVPEFRSNRA